MGAHLIRLILSVLILFYCANSQAASQERTVLNVDLFLSSTCPHCHKADAFFKSIEKSKSWLVVHRYIINQDKLALKSFYEHLQQQQSSNFSVPAIFFCGARWAGFADEKTTGKALLRALSYCRAEIIKYGRLTPATTAVLQKWGIASQVEIGAGIKQSTVTLVPVTALSDALNPCSLFCLAALLAFLWLTKEWVIGVIFILSQGMMHYLQQVYSAFFYQNFLYMHLLAVLVGLSLLFMVFKNLRKKDRNHTRIAVVILAAALVQLYQQTCEFNLSLVFEQWLIEQTSSHLKQAVYLFLYQIFYILPFGLVTGLYFILNRFPWMTRAQVVLKFAAYLILISIGIILLIYPQLLAHLWVSIIVLLGSIIIGWVVERYYEQIK